MPTDSSALLQLLRPEEFPEDVSFEQRLARGTPLPPCTSSTRRADIGGLPPRVGLPVALTYPSSWQLRDTIEATVRGAVASDAGARRQKIDRVRRALASGAALSAVLGPDEQALREQAEAMDVSDPRLEWLLSQAPRWRDARDKTLVFVAHRETLEMLRTALSHRAQLATGVFHEELSPAQRDTEVARFRDHDGPSLLVSTESGGEGRNFEFCRRLVLFDLPWKPSTVEQRIGRLDRIGRRIPVEIVYFRPPSGIGSDVVRLFETLGLFREPLAGLEPQLAHVEGALEEIALDPSASLSAEQFDALVSEAHAARTRIREAAYQQLHRDPYRSDMGAGILARVPRELDELNQEVVVTACIGLGFTIERPRGHRIFAIELGNGALVDGLPGVPGRSSYVGTFDREEAVEKETIDFFASGHPLVEGIFAHFEESALGRVARFEVEIGQEHGEGLVAVYKDGPVFEVVVIDSADQTRPDWAAAIRQRPLRAQPVTRTLRKALTGQAWSAVWVHSSTRRVVRTLSRQSSCDRCGRLRHCPSRHWWARTSEISTGTWSNRCRLIANPHHQFEDHLNNTFIHLQSSRWGTGHGPAASMRDWCATRPGPTRQVTRPISASSPKGSQMSTTGTIKRITDKGFGFIAAPDGTEYFFHQSACTSTPFDSMRQGESVTFTIGQGPKGPRAENVVPA